jgi:hypothetical protein
MADLAQIAQSGVDPISGSYLSAEKRKALFKRSKVSSNIFGGGGALVPISKKSDPETLAIVKSQSSSITSVQQQVNTLSSEVANLNKVIFIQTQTVNGVQELVGSLRGEVTGFNSSLNNVAKAINTDSVLEQNRIKQENEEQRRATELGLRAGRESLLEKAIQNALIAPVQAIAQKTQSILSRLSQFFGTLLLGWLTNQGIETLRALSEDNGKKLIEIRDNVLKALGIGAATLFLLNGGFLAIAGTITRLSLKIGGWLLKNTIGRFFGALGALLKSAGSAIVSTAKAGAAVITGKGTKAPTPATAAAGSADDVARAAAPAARAGAAVADDAAKATAKTAGRFVPGLGTVISGGAALYDFSRGDPLGGALNTIGMLPGPFGWAGTLGRLALEGTRIAGGTDNKPQTPSATSPTPTKSTTTAVKPQSPVIPSSTKPPTTTAAPAAALSDKPFEQQMSDLKAQANSIDFTQAPQYGELNITPEDNRQVSSQSTQVNIRPLPAQTDRISTQVNVGPAPAPAPNVIYRRVGSSAQQRSGAAPTGGPVNEVPSILASNPDNFYVLYSQVNYNVVT